MPIYEHVTDRWDPKVAEKLNPLERLVYRSNCLGSDQRITNTGGGNTSSKIRERDPLTEEPCEVLWVKGSGGDLRTSKAENFAALYLEKLFKLRSTYLKLRPEDRGPKSNAEDAMVGYFPHCTFDLNPRASSIDTPLHGFLPAKNIDHMHPNAVISIAASRRSRELTKEVFGGKVGWVPWLRPGFELGLTMQHEVEAAPELSGLVMGQHGLINWANDDYACYRLTLDLIEQASRYIASKDKGERTFGGEKYKPLSDSEREQVLYDILPWLRGQISKSQRFVGTVQCDSTILRFVNSHDAPRLAELGTSCPDHFLRTKIKPLYVHWDPQTHDTNNLKQLLLEGLETYRLDYAAYYDRCRHPNSPAMRDPNPTVVLIPGIGMVAWGKNKSESRVTAEFYNCAVEVMRGSEAMDEYVALPQQEAFDIEYWLLEEAKLKRMPPDREFARSICVVVGAGSGIGRCTALRLAKEGAHVVCADLQIGHAQETADMILAKFGHGIGVAGTGISGCGPAVAVSVDITNPESIQSLLKTTVLAYGGLDSVIVTAGVFVAPDKSGRVKQEQWRFTFDVNVLGAYNMVDGCRALFESQGLKGTAVITTSVNGIVPKKGSLAYDTSKAAANHLVRELAMELAPLVRVNGVAPATVVQGSTMFPRDRVISSLAKYGVVFAESESDDVLRDKLANFYAQRTLTKTAITPDDQADAILFLVSAQSSKTTGQILSVDGGLHEAFLR
jgi:rhamnulose-1-phosphate aldolase/alcohol dehydrogenase